MANNSYGNGANVARDLAARVSPDAIVERLGLGTLIGRPMVGCVMHDQAKSARREEARARRRAHGDSTGSSVLDLVFGAAVQNYYTKKDRWAYWRRKWGLTYTARWMVLHGEVDDPMTREEILVLDEPKEQENA